MAGRQAIVIGAGFFGVNVALYLREQRGFDDILLIEREGDVLQRASFRNQARIHSGYHYPRSFTTAFRSRANVPGFLRDFASAARSDFVKLYAIARDDSKVSARQFVRFCREIGAPIQAARSSMAALFDARRIEAVFEVEEAAFDAGVLQEWARGSLSAAGIELRTDTAVMAINGCADGLRLEARRGENTSFETAPYVFNCTYSGLTAFGASRALLKHELAELVLVKVPAELHDMGVTVMDGPFFSMMPFPARGLHSFSHVRFTPHRHWGDTPGQDAYAALDGQQETRFDRMRRDAMRLMPALAGLERIDSLFEIKTLLPRNEVDDGRPILFETSTELPGLYSILGGKIDNIYDVLERLDSEPLVPHACARRQSA
jgi:glycine/D-amino acid oxidase-like deaminating enzyme